MQGCHKCEYNNMKRRADYDKSPCSRCRAVLDPQIENNVPYEKIQNMEKYAMNSSVFDESSIDGALVALAKCIIPLIEMRDSAPATFSVVFSKIKYPRLPNSQIAHIANCSRNSVSRHLSKAFEQLPELEKLLDSRGRR